MTKKLLFLLFVVLTAPTLVTAATLNTLDIEFAFTVPANLQGQLLGYRLYQEGERICETTDPTVSKVTCDVYAEDGTYSFALSAYYSNGIESAQSPPFQFTIDSTANIPPAQPPTAVLSSSTAAGYAPLTVTFDGSSSSAPSSSIVSYNWSFGDGSNATGETVSHVYTSAGTFSAELTVANNQGLSDTATTPVVVTEPVPVNTKPIASIATSVTAGTTPLTVLFDGSQSSDQDGSITGYIWSFGDGATGSGQKTQHAYSTPGIYTVSLQVTDNGGETATSSCEIVCDAATPINLPKIEAGEVPIDHNWVRVLFGKTFINPIVVAGPPSFNGSDPGEVRIRNIDQEGFEVRLQEWDYLDGTHNTETINYIVMEKGNYVLDNGTKIEAGTFTGTNKFRQVNLQQAYSLTPVILSQIVSENESDAVTGRIRNISQNGFEYLLQEQELTKSSHQNEAVAYIAWEPGKGEIAGIPYEAGMAAQSVNQNWFNIVFETEFSDIPFFVAGMQTYAGGDTATIRSQNMSEISTQIAVQEEQSKDKEVNHVKESVGYVIIGAKSEPQAVQVNTTIWQESAVPETVDPGPDSAVELGMKFRSDTDGFVTAVRFYKASNNTGAHIGNLWTSTGKLLATVTFTNETTAGWQQANFSTPIAIKANTVYVVSYHTNVGHYSDDQGYFASNGIDNPPLHALADGASGSNGVYAYGSASSFPNQGWHESNYWVDVVFSAPAP